MKLIIFFFSFLFTFLTYAQVDEKKLIERLNPTNDPSFKLLYHYADSREKIVDGFSSKEIFANFIILIEEACDLLTTNEYDAYLKILQDSSPDNHWTEEQIKSWIANITELKSKVGSLEREDCGGIR